MRLNLESDRSPEIALTIQVTISGDQVPAVTIRSRQVQQQPASLTGGGLGAAYPARAAPTPPVPLPAASTMPSPSRRSLLLGLLASIGQLSGALRVDFATDLKSYSLTHGGTTLFAGDAGIALFADGGWYTQKPAEGATRELLLTGHRMLSGSTDPSAPSLGAYSVRTVTFSFYGTFPAESPMYAPRNRLLLSRFLWDFPC
eukprot:SAG31_NODE_4592_length_3107_cov_9.144729_3_plen_201_part_00